MFDNDIDLIMTINRLEGEIEESRKLIATLESIIRDRKYSIAQLEHLIDLMKELVYE